MTTINLHPRRAARQCVLKALFAYQFSKNDTIDQLMSENPELKGNNDFIQSLFDIVLENGKLTENIIKSHLENWEIDRVALIDKILLKMGICEIYFIDDIPPKVTISEMVEIAKIYSTDESPVFINGILDAVFKNYIKENKK
ncbi:MAG: transcription antitermination factor NusB [Candidatus Marinimicrobia bacterium]|nr:transcription antitermination factor NusB [Candidatus Neomarinimicrobiota bacterium]